MPFLIRYKNWINGEPEPDRWEYAPVPTMTYNIAVSKAVFYKNTRQIIGRFYAFRRTAGTNVKVQLVEWNPATNSYTVIDERTSHIPPLKFPDRIKAFREERQKEFEDRMKRFEETKKRLGIRTEYFSLFGIFKW